MTVILFFALSYSFTDTFTSEYVYLDTFSLLLLILCTRSSWRPITDTFPLFRLIQIRLFQLCQIDSFDHISYIYIYNFLVPSNERGISTALFTLITNIFHCILLIIDIFHGGFCLQIQFHGARFEELQEFIDVEHLPSDYGGKGPAYTNEVISCFW